MVLFGKASDFLIFMHVSVYFMYNFLFLCIYSAYLKKQLLFYLFYFPIGLVYMVLFGKASGFLIFMHVSVYFYV